ncbi:MAG: ribokinase [Actinomycetota bacterium]|jgi:ribokinase|nr:ribokinase [Actinomycetota bacterium]
MSPVVDATVAVVGSANLDIVVKLDRVPERGETVFGTGYEEHPGGKGANQAVASARLVKTSIVASVGQDSAGRQLLDHLAARGVDTANVHQSATPTGRAFINVTPDGENSITVLSLANASLTNAEVTDALNRLQPRVVVAQQEISAAALSATVKWCSSNSARLVLNASPSGPLPAGALKLADPLIVNEVEARAVLGFDESHMADHATLARSLAAQSKSVVLTAGAKGAFVAQGSKVTKIPAHVVKAVDTTGAGDEFAGTLAAGIARGDGLIGAASHANAAASQVIQIPRAQR